MARLLPLVLLAFKAWMFIDAMRRRSDTHWLWLIAVVPFGDVAYFFMVKLRDPGMQSLQRHMLEGFRRPPPVDELEHRYRTTPSLQNRIALAQRLFDAGRFAEAQQHFEEVLTREPDHKDSLYGLGLCRLEQGDPAGAAAPLGRLIEKYRSYRDYAAWPDLAEALWQSGEEEAAVELMVDLVRAAPRLRHHVLRARYLSRARRSAEAEAILREALADNRRSSYGERWRNRAWASEAERMLESLAAPAPVTE